MRISKLFPVALSGLTFIFLATLFSAPLQADVKKMEGKVTGQVICLYSWKTDEARGEAYQGGHAICPNAEHDRSLITKDGKIYILEPADNASPEVVKFVRTDAYERKDVIVEGDIVKIDKNVSLIRVKSFKVK